MRISQQLKNQISDLIKKGDSKLMNQVADSVGQVLADKRDDGRRPQAMSSSKIRNFHDKLLLIDDKDKSALLNELYVLKYHLAYVVGKEKNTIDSLVGYFYQVVEVAIDACSESTFKDFKNFIEAIIAYHRFHGGKE